MKEKISKLLVSIACIALMVTGVFILAYMQYGQVAPHENIAVPNLTTALEYKVSGTITFYENGRMIARYSGLDPMTNLGLNLTLTKLTGDPHYNQTTYDLNMDKISLGNYTGAAPVDATSTKLPNEFIRVSGVIHDTLYNGFNITGTFSGFAGTNDSNCMGINYESMTLGYDDLAAWLTFPQVTGITSSYVVIAEIKVQVTTS